MTGSMEEAVLEMYLQGVSTRKVEQITGRLSGVKISKDAVSRIAQRLDEALKTWRERRLEGSYPYLYLDATYLKVNWAGAVRDMALLVALGVNEEGYREVLAVEAALGERKELYRLMLKGLIERGRACVWSSATSTNRSSRRSRWSSRRRSGSGAWCISSAIFWPISPRGSFAPWRPI